MHGIGFTVPRLGSTSYTPGTPALSKLQVEVSTTTSPTATNTRNYFQRGRTTSPRATATRARVA
jgi:hypothetical protein